MEMACIFIRNEQSRDKYLKIMDKFIKGAVFFLFMLSSILPIKAYNSDDVFFFVVPKGYTMTTLSNTLSVSQDVLYKYNPDLREGLRAGMQIYLPASTVSEENLKKVDAAPTFVGGALNSVYSYALNEYAKHSQSQRELKNLYVNIPVKDRIGKGSQLYRYDEISIEGEPFWSLNNIHMDVTANQISETTGIPLDQLKLYCNYAAELKGYDTRDEKNRFNVICQYYLSHPTTTRKELEDVSRAMFQGYNYHLSIYIPTDPSSLKVNSDGSVDLPAVIPSKIESANTLRKFFSNSPRFKCSQTNVTLTLSYDATDGFVAYVDGKRLGKFEVDTREDQPQKALIGLPWLNGYGPAPMLLTLNGNNTTLALLPVQGEENLSYNSRGYLQHGRTGNTTWMQLSLSSNGISFTPVNYKPDPEMFRFIGFKN